VHDLFQGCVFTRDINKAILISDAMETGTVQINSAPARGPDHFPFQVLAITITVDLEQPAVTINLRQEVNLLQVFLILCFLCIAGSEGQWHWIPGDN
jgi:hypothetical protein